MLSLLFAAVIPLVVAQSATSIREPPESTVHPSASAIAAAAATATPLSPVSNVQGVAFQRFYQIWLENTDYDAAAGDANQQALAKQGISLTNYNAVTHPSEPNYAASAAGDYFGMDNDDFHSIPANISTVADMLDYKGISWAEYQENLPYPGFQGFNYSNQTTFANNYVRKHNPLMLFQSVTNNATRLSLIKNFTSFHQDVAQKTLPQWAFITPNMLDDGHDTNVTYAAKWESSFLAPLLNNSYFMNGTLLLLTYDENETYNKKNTIYSVLIGGPGVIPESLKGTTDNTFYNHYSTISTLAVNFGLPQLGRWDCEANVFAVVANKTGYTNANVDMTNLYFNQSYPGPLSDTSYIPVWNAPNTTAKCASGMGVLPSVQKIWGTQQEGLNYTNVYPYDAVHNNAANSPLVTNGQANITSSSNGTTTGGTGTSNSGSAASPSSTHSGSSSNFASAGLIGAALAVAALML